MNTRGKKRVVIVQTYLEGEKSLRKVAKEFNISYITLWRWVNKYKSSAKQKSRSDIFRHGKKISEEVERKVVLLKENNPCLTISQAKINLAKDDIKISNKTIWSIWRKFGLIGFSKMIGDSNLLSIFRKNTAIVTPQIKDARELWNSLGEIPYLEYYGKVRQLRKHLEREKFYYSAVRLGITEAIALSWMAKAKEQLSLIHHLKKMTPKRGDLYLKYQLLIGEGIACARILEVEKALSCAKICHRVLKKLKNAVRLWRELANLYNHIGRCKEARRIIDDILAGNLGEYEERDRVFFYADLANLLATSGEYRQCLNIIDKIDERKFAFRALILILRAQCLFAQGSVYKAKDVAMRALKHAKKHESLSGLHGASLIFAGISAAMGEKSKARSIIRRLNPLFRKSKMKKDVFVREVLSSPDYKKVNMKKYPSGILSHPVCQLTFLMAKAAATLKLKDYQRTYNYAVKHMLCGLFHRLCILIPEPVINVLVKGKPTGIPKSILKLPIFKKGIPVFDIHFLSPLKIFKRENGTSSRKFLNVELPPKDKAFLIYLALNNTNKIPLETIFRYFWPRSANALQNLSHLLVRLKKSLKISSHLIFIRKNYLYCDCYLTSDWHQFNQIITQAQAYERLEQWSMAEKEYLLAFSLFRDEPFYEMYDNFSEEKRLEIIFKFEESTKHFIKEVLKHTETKRSDFNKISFCIRKKYFKKYVAVSSV